MLSGEVELSSDSIAGWWMATPVPIGAEPTGRSTQPHMFRAVDNKFMLHEDSELNVVSA